MFKKVKKSLLSDTITFLRTLFTADFSAVFTIHYKIIEQIAYQMSDIFIIIKKMRKKIYLFLTFNKMYVIIAQHYFKKIKDFKTN